MGGSGFIRSEVCVVACVCVLGASQLLIIVHYEYIYRGATIGIQRSHSAAASLNSELAGAKPALIMAAV